MILSKIRQAFAVLRHKSDYVDGPSYYPDCEHKSKKEILRDQLYFCLKYGKPEPFYYTYGFDRKEMTRERMCSEYLIPYKHFQKRINKLNFQNPRYDDFHGKLTGRVITGDKFYFNIFLEKFGIPTPKVLCFIKDRKPLYVDPKFRVDVSAAGNEQVLSFLANDMDAFAKPSDGQLGNGIFSLRVQGADVYVDGKPASRQEVVEKLLSADYLVQERITQHPKMATLCSATLNTIRLQTIMDKEGNVHAFGAALRVGREGLSVDNWAKGGVLVGIDMEKGTLLETGFLKPQFGTSTIEHPDTHIPFKDFEIPFYKEAEALAVKLHHYLYRCHSIGWDIAITEKGPVFIEGNGWWEISMPQAVHGGLRKEIELYFYG